MKNMKKALALTLTVCMVFAVVLTISVYAEETSYGGEVIVLDGDGAELYKGTEFDSAITALNTATGVATVIFNGNVETECKFDIKVPCQVVGNGHTLNYIGTGYALQAFGSAYLNSDGDGAMTTYETGGTLDPTSVTEFTAVKVKDLNVISAKGGVGLYLGADITLENVDITTYGSQTFYACRQGAARLTLNGGKYIQNANSQLTTLGRDQVFTVNDATLTQTKAQRLISANGTSVVMNGGTLDQQAGSLVAGFEEASSFTLNGGSLLAGTSGNTLSLTDGSSFIMNSGSIITDRSSTTSNAINVTDGTVTINGGTIINATKGATFRTANTSRIVINGGIVSTSVGDVFDISSTSGVAVTVKGGVMTSDRGDIFQFANITTSAGINIYGGYLYGGNRAFNAFSQNSTIVTGIVNIYGGTIVSGTRIWAYSGAVDLYIYGGELIAGGVSTDATTYFTSGNVDICHISGCRIGIPATHTVFNTNGRSIVEDYIGQDDGDGYPWIVVGDMKYIGGNGFALVDGAAVRLVDDRMGHGIRFTSTFTSDAIAWIDGLKDANTELTYGTVLVPTEKLVNVKAYTVEGLEGAGLKARSEALTSGYDFAVIPSTTAEVNGNSVIVRCSLVGLKSVEREFLAIPYVMYVKDGAKVYVYGEVYNESTDSRCMAEIAFKALGDMKDSEDLSLGYRIRVESEYTVTYGGETVTVSAGKWVPYTAEQRDTLMGYLAD